MRRLLIWIRRRPYATAVLTATALVIGYLGYNAVATWIAWRNIDRVEFDLEQSRSVLAGSTPTPQVESGSITIPVHRIDPAVDLSFDAYLLVGSDQDKNLQPERLGDPQQIYGDAILLYLVPTEAPPALVSLPRDVLVTSPCTGRATKLSGMLAGCGEVTGPELLAIAVEDFTGIKIDHFGVISFTGFVDVIDGLGGIPLCVPRALREGNLDILPAGCSVATGTQALRYLRSRTTQELVNDEWRAIPNVSDLTRVERQQEVLFAVLAEVKKLNSPGALTDLVQSLDDGAIVLDETLSMREAISWAWELRGTPPASIRRIVLPTEPTVTVDGRFALRATRPLLEVLADS